MRFFKHLFLGLVRHLTMQKSNRKVRLQTQGYHTSADKNEQGKLDHNLILMGTDAHFESHNL